MGVGCRRFRQQIVTFYFDVSPRQRGSPFRRLQAARPLQAWFSWRWTKPRRLRHIAENFPLFPLIPQLTVVGPAAGNVGDTGNVSGRE